MHFHLPTTKSSLPSHSDRCLYHGCCFPHSQLIYVKGGPYTAFAGCDATKALATFSVDDVKEIIFRYI